MDWIHFHDQFFDLDYPPGWRVQSAPDFPSCVVFSPDGLQFAIIQPVPTSPGVTPAEMIQKGQVPIAHLFPSGQTKNIVATDANSSEAEVHYKSADDSPGRAQLVYIGFGEIGLLCGFASPAATFDAAIPTISRILRSHNEPLMQGMAAKAKASDPQSHPTPQTPRSTPPPIPNHPPATSATTAPSAANMAGSLGPLPAPFAQSAQASAANHLSPASHAPPAPHTPAGVNLASVLAASASLIVSAPPATPHAAPNMPIAPSMPSPIQFKPFTEPRTGTYTLDAPVGWQINGGLHHPAPGDRRAWFEANSPDGIYILSDPMFPHSLCTMWLGPNGKVVPVAAGGHFLCLKPGAESSADCYLKQIGPKRLANFHQISRRPRPDVIEMMKKKLAASNFKIGRKGQVSAVETILQRTGPGPTLVASLLTGCIFNGDYGIGIGFWDSNNILAVSPIHLAATAEYVRTRMAASMNWTPAMYQIYQQDEAQITANAQAANQAQWNWFANQQAQHNAQVVAGDAYVNNYWSTQQANDNMLRGWEQNQAVYDRISENRQDEMLDRQRLSDDAAGKTYEVANNANYYWKDEKTGNVIGTETDQPPDNLNNYTGLRKL